MATPSSTIDFANGDAIMPYKAYRTTGLLVGIVFLFVIESLRGQPLPQQRPATIRLRLPFANARVMIDEMQTRQTGTERVFVSPPLQPDRGYSYTIKVIWEPNNYTTITRTRKVAVKAG